MGIRDRRVNYKPFEYPEINEVVRAIQQAYWVHDEVSFEADVQDYNVNLPKFKRTATIRTLLTIAQTEVAVKPFWGDLHHTYPKPELNGLGVTIAEDEYRHSEAYARIMEVLGLNDMFVDILEIPIFQEKLEFIKEHMSKDLSDVERMLFFAIVIENSTLFSHFGTILSLFKFDKIMPKVANVIKWTSIDEQWHANAGIMILNIIQKEDGPLDANKVHSLVKKAVDFEERFLEWVFEEGEFPDFTKKNLLDFIKFRIDVALGQLSLPLLYNITKEEYQPMAWFTFEVFGETYDDFFAHRPTNYTKHDKPITRLDLFNEGSTYFKPKNLPTG